MFRNNLHRERAQRAAKVFFFGSMNFTLEFFHESKRNHPQKNDEIKNKREVKEEKENEFQSNVHASSNGTYSSKKTTQNVVEFGREESVG